MKAMTNLTLLAGLPGVREIINKPDSTTMASSCYHESNRCYVHFRQLSLDGKPGWYLAKVLRYLMDEEERLRRDIHNILNWGVLKRINDIRKFLDDWILG